MDLIYWLLAVAAAFSVGFSKGGFPAFAAIAVPLLSFRMSPVLAAGLLLPLYLLADIYAIYLFRKTFSVENLKILLPAGAMGVLIGFGTVSLISADAVRLVLAGIGISFVANAWVKKLRKREAQPTKPHRFRGSIWGSLAGLTSYIAHAGGPPYQTYMLPQKLDKLVYIGTTTIFFATVNLLKLPTYILNDQMSWSGLGQAAWLAPAALIGAWTGAQFSRRIPDWIFYLFLEAALLLMCLKLAYDGLT